MRVRSLSFVALLVATAAMAQTPPARFSRTPAVSPDGKWIAFISNRDGTTDLYVVPAGGETLRRLTATSDSESSPSWSKNGRHVFFAVMEKESSRLYSVPVRGGEPRLIGHVAGRAASVAPNGRDVLYSTGDWTSMHLSRAKVDGSGAREIANEPSAIWNAHFDPDAKRIAFTGRETNGNLHVWTMNADGSDRRPVTHIPVDEGRAEVPAWSPDGKRLAFQWGAADRKSHIAHVAVLDLGSGKIERLAQHSAPFLDECPSWFPDGKRLAFQSDRSGEMQIWTMNADGTGLKQITK